MVQSEYRVTLTTISVDKEADHSALILIAKLRSPVVYCNAILSGICQYNGKHWNGVK